MNNSQPRFEPLAELCSGVKDIFFISLNKNRTINFHSDNVSYITGYTVNEINSLPEKIHSLIGEEYLPAIKKEIADFESDSSKNGIEYSYRITSKDGKSIWLKEIQNVTRDSEGEIIQTDSIFINLTPSKTKEAELEKAYGKLTEINAAKDKFISIISHDLRAPFTTLLGFSEILLNEKDISEEEKNEYLRYIYDASKTQLNLINCLLDWSRLQTGRIKVEPARLNVKSAIAIAITPLTGDAVRKNIEVKIDIPADLYMSADERLISQAVLTLVSNAIKYTPEGKEVLIFSQRFKAGMIELVVRDEGLGIAEENQTKLFRIDQKFSLVGTNGEKGSGLGLTLMKEIIDKHGGQVWFYSKVGEGSEFHFTVPEAKNIALIVEDEIPVRTLYQRAIEAEMPNFEVKTADNGYEAIKMLKDFIPTIIITDHDMPLMNGIQLIEAIYKKESGKTIPVIVVSAKLNDEINRSYSKLGVDKIIPKPVNLEILVEAMKECLY
ncbi:MAG: response regulator [Ignavibacteriales bacterium]|nr:response regulator [Ignavibacteriales bacterium]